VAALPQETEMFKFVVFLLWLIKTRHFSTDRNFVIRPPISIFFGA